MLKVMKHFGSKLSLLLISEAKQLETSLRFRHCDIHSSVNTLQRFLTVFFLFFHLQQLFVYNFCFSASLLVSFVQNDFCFSLSLCKSLLLLNFFLLLSFAVYYPFSPSQSVSISSLFSNSRLWTDF